MRNDDVLAQLRAVNPVTEADLSPVDPGALVALREGITMTGRQLPLPNSSKRRIGRRGATGAIVTIALLGGGAAYAAHQQWYVGGSLADGITCVTQWADPTEHTLESTGGPALTGDPVADCQHYQTLSDRAPITDPVAFRLDDPRIYVAPRSQMPANATVVSAATPRDDATSELEASAHDFVDGLGSRCLSGDEALKFAQSELDRLGLTDWTVANGPAGPRPPVSDVSGRDPSDKLPCARVSLDRDHHAVLVAPNDSDDIDTLNGAGYAPFVYELRDALRTGITNKCVSLTDAKAVATSALGDAHHWPLTAIEDPKASCTRVDMVVGGSVQITLRGPATAIP